MAIEVSKEGITQASQSLLNCASELSELFDNIAQITSSIGTNLTGFSEVEELIVGLREMDSVKDSLISKINEFGNYLTSTVIEGYDSFINALGSIDIDTSFLTTLASLFEVKLESNTFNSNGISESTITDDSLIAQVKPITNEDVTTDSSTETTKTGDTSTQNTTGSTSNYTYSATAEEIDSPIRTKTVTPRTLPITDDELKRMKDPRGPKVELPPDPNRPVKY